MEVISIVTLWLFCSESFSTCSREGNSSAVPSLPCSANTRIVLSGVLIVGSADTVKIDEEATKLLDATKLEKKAEQQVAL